MKTAISVPDKVFQEADSFAKRHHISRSALFTEAVKTYVEHHRPSEVKRQLDEVYAKEPSLLDDLLQQIQIHSITKEEW